MASLPASIPQQPDEVRAHLATLHARFLSLQSSSTRRIGPAMAFFEPFLRRSPTLSFVRCTVCVPGPVPRAVAESVKIELSKAARSDGGVAISKGKVSRIRGFVARSSRTAAGGTSSLFNHAHRSHPTLLAALRELIERDMPSVRPRGGQGQLRLSGGRAGKKRRKLSRVPARQPAPRLARPSAAMVKVSAAVACALLPPGGRGGVWGKEIFREGVAEVSHREMVSSAWPFLREEIKARVAGRFSGVGGVSLTLDEWNVAGRGNRVWAVSAHFVDGAWKRHVINIGMVALNMRSPGLGLDVRRLLDAFLIRERVFGVIDSPEVGVIVDGRISDVVSECFRGRCLFTAVADAAYRLACGGGGGDVYALRQHLGDNAEHPLVIHGESEASIESTAAAVARCIHQIRESTCMTGSVTRVPGFPGTEANAAEMGASGIPDISGDGAPGVGHADASVHMSTATPSVSAGMGAGPSSGAAGSATGANSLQDVLSDGTAVATAVHVAAAAAARAGDDVGAGEVHAQPSVPLLPKPWLKGCFLSLLTEWEALIALNEPVSGFTEEHVQPVRELLDEHWVIIRAVVKALAIVRAHVGQKRGWVMLPDCLMMVINLVCGICDRLTEIEMLVDQNMLPNAQHSNVRHYMTECLRSHQVRPEDAEASSPVVALVEGYLLNQVLFDLYPLIQPLTEYVSKQSYCIMGLALDPRYASLASLISLNKKLMQGSRLLYEKEFPNEDATGSDERIRKQVLTILSRYDHEVMIPIMLALNSKYGSRPSEEPTPAKVGADAEEGLFAETFEPTEDWKNRQTLDAELTKFRTYKKNIARTATSAECLAWWETNAELFPNISQLFRKVISIPASCARVERVLTTDGGKIKVARRRLGRSGLEDFVFIHENLDVDMLVEINGGQRSKSEEEEVCVELMDDETLFELAPEFFSSE